MSANERNADAEGIGQLRSVSESLDKETAAWQTQDVRHRITPAQQLMSACLGGLITTFVVTPLDVVKTRLQTQHATRQKLPISKLCYVFHNGLMTHVCKPDSKSCRKQVLEDIRVRPSRGAMDTFIKIICNDGFFGLWSGLGPTLLSALPSTMMYFLAYDYLKYLLTDMYIAFKHKRREQKSRQEHDVPLVPTVTSNERLPFLVPMLSGILSRSMVVTAVTPIEMIRIKMQSQHTTYSEIRNVIKNLVATQGMRGLWRGLPPTIMRDAPFSGTYWASYEMWKRIFDVNEPTFHFSFIAGACSGVLATLVTMPFDLITTHTQIELGEDMLYADNGSARDQHKKSKSSARVTAFSRLGAIYRAEGIGGLYVGTTPRMLRVVPACAIMISMFEYSKAFFFHYNSSMVNSGQSDPVDFTLSTF